MQGIVHTSGIRCHTCKGARHHSEQEGINKDERDIYKDVLQDLKRGISLSDAMESKECFPDLMIGMIRSGEGSGNLDLVTQRLSISMRRIIADPAGEVSHDLSMYSAGALCCNCDFDRNLYSATVSESV